MAPTESHVEWQTSQIIKYLFEDDDNIECRQMNCCIEADGPADEFDPVLIADKLRSVGDSLNDDATLRASLAGLRNAAAQEAVEAAFSHGVEALCQTQVSQSAEVASEVQLIKASVALGLYVIKSAPELKNKVQGAMNAFLNRHVCTYVTKQGGWDKVDV